MPDTSASMSASSSASLLDWYDRHHRRLPWRAPPGTTGDPYRVWLSEIMLQQTTVATVTGYFADFIARWPTVYDLAAAPLDDVLHAWAGLGYYARARNLHRCAQVVSRDHHGRFPDTEAGLATLPGIGLYTAAAVAAIAFGQAVVPVDGNIERVVARQFDVADPLPAAKPILKQLARGLDPAGRPGDFAQALMDLGATICTPRRPRCALCPIATGCRARQHQTAEDRPVKAPKAEKPVRSGVAFWLTDPAGSVLLRRRPEKGLLGGMIEVPTSPWIPDRATPPLLGDVIGSAPADVSWTPLPGVVRHTFTHFHLTLSVVAGRLSAAAMSPAADERWVAIDALGDHALPTVMRKIARHALAVGVPRA